MTVIVRHNGKIITHGGKIGTGEGCCCGEPCDPCAFSGGPVVDFPTARLVGTWDAGGGSTAFDWLAPADQWITGYINRGWANNSRPPQGTAASAPDTRVHATVWKWDGSTETCGTLDEIGDVVEAEVPSLRTCGDSACSAWFYGEPGSVNAVMSAREYRTLIANPPPDDGQWYTFIYIEAIIGGPLVWYWAWIPYCTQTCGEVALSSDGPSPDSLVIDTFTLACEMGDACCAGNDEYPIYKLVNSECEGGHNNVDYSAQTSDLDVPPCLGACCGDVDPTQGPPLIALSIQSCFGSGAAASVTAPAGNPSLDAGPLFLAGLSLDAGGSGYAKLGRVFPTVSVGGGSGSGATFTPTVLPYPYVNPDACDLPGWHITAVTPSGGTGYVDGEQLTVSVAAGDTAEVAAVVTVHAVRSQPTLSASVSGGTGATLTVSTSSNGTTPQTWGVSGVSVGGTTSGYTDGAAVTFSYGAGVTEQAAAVATIKTARTTPTITASASGGSGASLTVNLSQSPTTPSDTALWHVDSVTVADGGTGYTDGDPVTFTVSDGTQVTAASGTIATSAGRENPNLTPYVWGVDGTTGGSGAVLSATMVSNEDDPETWGVFPINVIEGGSGYEVGEYFWYSEFGTGFASIPPYYLVETDGWVITSVDENGAITGVGLDGYGGIGKFYKATGNGVIQSVTITNGGDYYKATSAISRVVVTDGGQYFYYDGTPTSCTVTNGGFFYREDADEPPLVAPVSVLITQTAPSAGINGSIGVVIDDDPQSASFGVITGLTVGNGGTGYLAWAWDTECANGQTKAECEASGGTWHSGAPCNSYPCNVFP